MYQGLRSVVYKVSDIEKAKVWYSKVFDTKPDSDTSFAVSFSIGDSVLALSPEVGATTKSDNEIVAFWDVDDVDSEFKRLLNLGATVHTEVNLSLNKKRAAVVDPFGNIIGIRTTIDGAEKQTLEQQPSQTAMGVALARAISAKDERVEIRGPDYLAEKILPDDMKDSLRDSGMMRKMVADSMPGMYEYAIARTAYFDRVFEQALRENYSQIVLLGAGYDTRAYRYKGLIKDTKIFEMDVRTTQQHKISVLHKNDISIPEQLTFVPIDFNTETLSDSLFNAGYKSGQKNLFIWEGVTYYLSPEAVDDTLSFIKSTSLPGSNVSFDYSAQWPEMLDAYGVRKLVETMRADYSGERTGFGIERGRIQSFLSERGYKMVNHLSAEDMEERFLTLRDGSLAGKVIGIFCLTQGLVLD